jgi:hypothetical protein
VSIDTKARTEAVRLMIEQHHLVPEEYIVNLQDSVDGLSKNNYAFSKSYSIAYQELLQLRELVKGFVDGAYGLNTFKNKAKEILK